MPLNKILIALGAVALTALSFAFGLALVRAVYLG